MTKKHYIALADVLRQTIPNEAVPAHNDTPQAHAYAHGRGGSMAGICGIGSLIPSRHPIPRSNVSDGSRISTASADRTEGKLL